MENYEKFEYFYNEEGKFKIGFFELKTYDSKWAQKFIDGRFKKDKFKYFETLKTQFKKLNLKGYPSNTGVNGGIVQEIELNNLTFKWFTNFSYEEAKHYTPPRVEIVFKKVILKTISNVSNTKIFVSILNKFNSPTEIINLFETKYGIEKCYQKLKIRFDKNELVKKFTS